MKCKLFSVFLFLYYYSIGFSQCITPYNIFGHSSSLHRSSIDLPNSLDYDLDGDIDIVTKTNKIIKNTGLNRPIFRLFSKYNLLYYNSLIKQFHNTNKKVFEMKKFHRKSCFDHITCRKRLSTCG